MAPGKRNRSCPPSEHGAGVACAAATESSKPIHVLLVENDSIAAEAITRDFGRNMVIVTTMTSLAGAKAFLRQRSNRVDVVVLALRLPDGRGESLLSDIEACARQPAVVIVSSFLPDLRSDALEYRPVVVAKPISTRALLRTVRTVVGGYARPVIQRFVTSFNLSKRETEAIALVAQGCKPKEVADRMSCSEPTVYGHLARACAKAGCSDYHEVVARLFAFACQTLGHTPPDHRAFVGRRSASRHPTSKADHLQTDAKRAEPPSQT